ncbi:MAG: Ig-like domain-containing protein, partial [Candidatus Solibacter sp.]
MSFPASIRIQPCSYANEEVVLDRLKTTSLTSFALVIVFAASASAQTATKLEIVSGNGQLFTSAAYKNVPFLYPMVVRVLDANGNPIANKTVNWNWTTSPTGGALASAEPTSVTDAKGIAYSRVFQGIQSGTPSLPYLQTVFTASADSASANFVVSQALLDNFTSSQLVFSQPNWYPGPPPTLTGAAGSVSTTPIKIHVDGRGLPIPNISVRLLNDDPKTLPSATCATDPGADPGSVVTDANGDATCYPVFGPIAGSASVSVLVGGLDPLQWDQASSPQPLTTA